MGEPSQHLRQRLSRLRWYALAALLAWSAAVGLSYRINAAHEHRITKELALTTARAAYFKDLAFRNWAASHGGVYVPITEETRPNPYLDVPHRDVTTQSGQRLTLLNPAYAFRQLLEDYSEVYGVFGRIMSLKPINPKNQPDPWERGALEAFEEQGLSERADLMQADGRPVLRMIRPVYVEPACLQCHAKQGYQVGDVRGGISVTVPMEPYLELQAEQIANHRTYHLLFLLAGLAAVGGIYWRSGRGLRRIHEVEAQLSEQADQLEETVARRTAEAVEARKRAEEASASRSAFLASMSHEIRTPLSGVIGVASLLADTELKPDQREYLETILYSGEYLLMIVNEVLDLSKIEAGKFEIHTAPTEPRKLIEETLDLFALKASEARLELFARFDPKAPAAVYLDRTRVRQILVNLLGNALKFTETGQVSVQLWLEDRPGGQTWLRFGVFDTGPGIPENQREHLFEPFVQGSEHQERGTGLGLNISKRLVELMGGSIWAENRPSGGAAFEFRLPAKLSPSPIDPALRPDGAALQGRRLLLLSANGEFAAALEDLLLPYGVDLFCSASQKQLSEELERCEQTCALAVDLGFGQEVPKDWLGEAARFLPVLVLVSLGERPDLPEAARLLRKPLREEALLRALLDSDRSAERLEEKLPDLSEIYPLKILLVEDNHINQMLAQKIFEKYGYRTDLAENGQQAVERAVEGGYDLIFMDIRMPVLNGVDAAEEIRRQLPRERWPIIIAMTANLMPQDRAEYRRAGMADLLAKPILPKEVGSMLSRWGRTLKKQRHLAHLRLPRDNPRLLDDQLIQSRLDVGGSFFEALREQYLSLAPQLLAGIQQATHRGDDLECMALAHRLGGMSDNIGAERMAALCFQVEVAANDNDLQRVAALLLETETVCAETAKALGRYAH